MKRTNVQPQREEGSHQKRGEEMNRGNAGTPRPQGTSRHANITDTDVPITHRSVGSSSNKAAGMLSDRKASREKRRTNHDDAQEYARKEVDEEDEAINIPDNRLHGVGTATELNRALSSIVTFIKPFIASYVPDEQYQHRYARSEHRLKRTGEGEEPQYPKSNVKQYCAKEPYTRHKDAERYRKITRVISGTCGKGQVVVDNTRREIA